MPDFSYTARNIEGSLIKGHIRADSPREAARSIAQEGLFVADLVAVSESKPFFAFLQRRIDKKYAVVFCREFSIMMQAGLSIDASLKILLTQHNPAVLQRMLQDLYEQIQAGSSLADALKRYPEVFPDTMVYLIAAGEVSGNLGTVLIKLAVYLEKGYAAREKIITVMLYPIFLLIVAGAAVSFILYFVLPTFVTLFANLHTELPLPTKILLQVSWFLRNYSLVLLMIAVLFFCAVSVLYHKSKYRLFFDRTILWCPVLGRLLRQIEFMRSASTLAILLGSGIVIDQAVLILKGITTNTYLQRIFLQVHEEVQKGYGLSTALARGKIFPQMLLELLGAGEATGEIENVLTKIASFCQSDVEIEIERLKILIEPIMILILGAIIATIVFAIALPILDTMTAFS